MTLSDGFVTAYDKRTGEKRRVPAHYFDNPRLSRGLLKTPRAKAQEKTRGTSQAKPTSGAASDTPATGDDKKE